MAVSTLVYFDFPVRAEVSRLLFTLGKVEFEDKRISYEEWPQIQNEWKPKCPFGQVPILMVNGKVLAQSAAIDRYVARLAGMMPDDPWKVALAEQAYFFCEDIFRTYYPTFRIEDPDEQLKARQALLVGDLADKLKLMSKLLEAREGKYITGDKLTHGDLAVFCQLGWLQSGWMKGFPEDLLDSYPVLKDFRNAVASVPQIAAYYSTATDDVRVKGFKPKP